MQVPVSEAKAHLTELVRRAESGEEVILTRHGRAVARLTAVGAPVVGAERRALIDEIRLASHGLARPGPDGARSQDFLYDENGLPR